MLDGLRGVAAGAVLFGHATAVISGHSLIDRKALAVQFFFMLSGFVIAYAYEARMKAGMPVKEFLLRRTIRLYPLIAVGAVLGSFRFATGNHHLASDPLMFIPSICAALALPSPPTWYSFGLFPINPPEWSLFYELLASVGFGVLIIRCESWHLITVAAVAFASYTVKTIDWFGLAGTPPFWSESFGAVASFCIGVLLWRYYQRGRLPRWTLPFSVLALVLLAACALPFTVGWEMDIVCVLLLFPTIIVCGATDTRGTAGRIEHFLGDLSYPLYILHWPVLLFAKRVLLTRIGPAGTIAIACALAVATAWIALVFLDRPVRQRLSEWLLP